MVIITIWKRRCWGDGHWNVVHCNICYFLYVFLLMRIQNGWCILQDGMGHCSVSARLDLVENVASADLAHLQFDSFMSKCVMYTWIVWIIIIVCLIKVHKHKNEPTLAIDQSQLLGHILSSTKWICDMGFKRAGKAVTSTQKHVHA